jgi:hypothetical protein
VVSCQQKNRAGYMVNNVVSRKTSLPRSGAAYRDLPGTAYCTRENTLGRDGPVRHGMSVAYPTRALGLFQAACSARRSRCTDGAERNLLHRASCISAEADLSSLPMDSAIRGL